MTTLQDNIPAEVTPVEQFGVEAQPFSLGATLREARVRLGLSVAEVSDRIKFAPRQIEALEADDFSHLPEIAFLRGFVRSYARLLQLDPAALLAALPLPAVHSLPVGEQSLAEVPFPTQTNKSNIVWLAAALVVAIALVLFVWLRGSTPDAPKLAAGTDASSANVESLVLPEAVPVSAVQDMAVASSVSIAPAISAVSAQPAQQTAASVTGAAIQSPAKPAVAASAVQQAAALRLTFDQDAWVEVKDRDGKILLSKVNHPGSEQAIGGTPPFTLVIGSASGVHLFYKGQPVDLAPHTKVAVAHLTLE